MLLSVENALKSVRRIYRFFFLSDSFPFKHRDSIVATFGRVRSRRQKTNVSYSNGDSHELTVQQKESISTVPPLFYFLIQFNKEYTSPISFRYARAFKIPERNKCMEFFCRRVVGSGVKRDKALPAT